MSHVVAELRKLSSIINGAIDRIEETLTARSLTFPTLAGLYTQESEEARNIPEVFRDANLITAAATQLAAAARPPPMTMLDNAYKCLQGAALRVAFQADVNPTKLARLLRLLASHQVFREVKPNIFANNKLSCMLDTGSSTAELITNPAAKDRGFPAFLGMSLEYSAKVAEHLIDVLFRPETAHSVKLEDAALPGSYGFKGSFFQFIEAPGNERHIRRFTEAMVGLTSFANRDAVLEAFDWQALPAGSIIVDIGGGNGSQTSILAQNVSGMHFVVQDREATLPSAVKLFTEAGLFGALESGQIEVKEHDFFTPQPIKNAAVFFLRHILHDWSDEDSVKILRNLRVSAGSNTRLVLQDQIIVYACDDSTQDDLAHGVPVPPEPVLTNWGQANSFAYYMDTQMMTVFQSSERTLAQWKNLLADGGWKLVDVRFGSRPFAVTNQSMTAVPA